MTFQDKGFLLSKNKYSENSAIAEFYTQKYGKISGIVFGATSKKIKNYLLIGNKFHLNFNTKNDDKLVYFKVEIDQIKTPIFLNNQKKLLCIIYAMNLIKILTPSNQENINIYNIIEKLFYILENKDWLLSFIFWELNIYKNVGYDIDFANYVKRINIDDEEKFVVFNSDKIVPNFLINKNNTPKNTNEIISGFKILGDFLEKTILKPNNISYPISRTEFVKLIK